MRGGGDGDGGFIDQALMLKARGVTGYGAVQPLKTPHKAASCPPPDVSDCTWESAYYTTDPNFHPLRGGLVGGPDDSDAWADDRDMNNPANTVSLLNSAGFSAAVAGLVAGDINMAKCQQGNGFIQALMLKARGVTGYGAVQPLKTPHKAASCPPPDVSDCTWESAYYTTDPNFHPLRGGLVGGPDDSDAWADDRDMNNPANTVSLLNSAGFSAAVAGLVAGDINMAKCQQGNGFIQALMLKARGVTGYGAVQPLKTPHKAASCPPPDVSDCTWESAYYTTDPNFHPLRGGLVGGPDNSDAWADDRDMNNPANTVSLLNSAGFSAAVAGLVAGDINMAKCQQGNGFIQALMLKARGVTGYGAVQPLKTPHKAASCPPPDVSDCTWESAYYTTDPNFHPLRGGLVGGPDNSDAWADDRDMNNPANTVSLLNSAGFSAAVAGLVAGDINMAKCQQGNGFIQALMLKARGVTGYGAVQPLKTPHKAASCPPPDVSDCTWESAYYTTDPNFHPLRGGLVGGPDDSDAWADDRDMNNPANTVSLLNSAGFSAAVAGLVAGDINMAKCQQGNGFIQALMLKARGMPDAAGQRWWELGA